MQRGCIPAQLWRDADDQQGADGHCSPAIQQAEKKGMPAGLLEQIIPKVNQLKFTLNPMHLLVQKAYFAYKETCHSRAQISAASPHDHRLNIFAAIVEEEL